MDRIGERIYKLRREKALTQDDIAETLNVSRQAVSRWERDLSMPETGNLSDLAKLLGTTVDYILSGETSSLPDSPQPPLIRPVAPPVSATEPLPPCSSASNTAKPRLPRAIKAVIGLLIAAVFALGASTTVLGLKAAQKNIELRYKLIQQQNIQALTIDVPCNVEISADDNYYYDSLSLYKWIYADGAASLIYDEFAREKLLLNNSPDTVLLRIPCDKAPSRIEIVNRSENPALQTGQSLNISGLNLPSTVLKIDDRFRNIKIENCNFAAFEILISNKNVTLCNVSVSGEAKFCDGNGNLEICDCLFGDVLTVDTRANTLIKNSTFLGYSSFITSNGDYVFEDTTVENLYLEIENGSISVKELSAKEIEFVSSTGSLSGDFKSLTALSCRGSALLELDITLPQKAENYTFTTEYKPRTYTAVNQRLNYAGNSYPITQNQTVGNGPVKIELEINTCRVDIRTAS